MNISLEYFLAVAEEESHSFFVGGIHCVNTIDLYVLTCRRLDDVFFVCLF